MTANTRGPSTTINSRSVLRSCRSSCPARPPAPPAARPARPARPSAPDLRVLAFTVTVQRRSTRTGTSVNSITDQTPPGSRAPDRQRRRCLQTPPLVAGTRDLPRWTPKNPPVTATLHRFPTSADGREDREHEARRRRSMPARFTKPADILLPGENPPLPANRNGARPARPRRRQTAGGGFGRQPSTAGRCRLEPRLLDATPSR